MDISNKYRPRLVVMVKEPHPGRVKTRLGNDIGMVPAAWWFRHHATNLIGRIQSPRWQTILAVSPDGEGLKSQVWPKHLARWPQGRGDLGQRMFGVFAAMPPGPVVIIGADIPAVGQRHIQHAFAALRNHDAVFGPASDGGYWAIGFRRIKPIPPSLFQSVRWSSTNALGDTLETLGGQTFARIETLNDVDTAADL